MNQHELGRYGEQLALEYLKAKKYRILKTNYRFLKAELDIVCTFKDLLVIVEVKTRQTDALGEPWRAVTKSKQKQIIKAANQFILDNNIHLDTRFDVISIVCHTNQSDIEHIEDAFSP